jgi:predicted porin
MIGRSRMKAMLLAAALTGLPAAARADLPPLQWKLYGFLNAQAERVWATGGATPYGARFRVSDGNSRIGFSGSINLGGAGVQGIWQIEASLANFEQGGQNDKGATAILASRNTFVGVQHEKYGRLVLGYVDSSYRSLVGSGGELGGNLGLTVQGLDLWNNTSAQMSGNPDSLFSRGETRLKNSIHYLSPEWIVRFGASYGLDEAVSNGQARNRLSLAARVKWNGLQLGVGFDQQANTGVNADALQQGLGQRTDLEPGASTLFYKAVASYTAPTGTYLGVGYERSQCDTLLLIPASPTDPVTHVEKRNLHQDGVMVSAAQTLGDATVMVSYGKLMDMQGSPFFPASSYQATQLSVGAKYAFDERFMTYVYFTAIDNKSEQNVNLGQSPIYSNNAGTSDACLSPGDSPRAVGAGLIARF